MAQNQGRAVELLDHVCHRERLARTRHPEQHVMARSALDLAHDRGDCLGLVARRGEVAMQLKAQFPLFLLFYFGTSPRKKLEHIAAAQDFAFDSAKYLERAVGVRHTAVARGDERATITVR